MRRPPMLRIGLAFGLVLATSTVASANPDAVLGLSGTSASITPGSALAPIAIVEGPGIKVGEGTVVHPILGLESAIISNAFYEESDPKPVGVTRVVARVAVGSLSPQRLQNPDGTEGTNGGTMDYRAALQLSYDLYMSSQETLQEQGGLGVGGLIRGTVFPKRTWSFLYLDNFERVLRATNFESTQRTNRDINRLHLGLRYAPEGRTVQALVHYANLIDFFEDDDQRFANRLHNTFGLTVSWRFRPMTVFWGEVTQGVHGGFGDESRKVNSYPLRATLGVQTLLSLKTALIGRIGYANGFYADGPSFSAVLGGLQLGYRYSPNGRIALMYEYGHQDSINANFYRDHAVQLDIEQRVERSIYLTVRPELRFRKYQGVNTIVAGPDTRSDVIFAATANARYMFRDSLGGLLEYRAAIVDTDYMSALGDDPSFVRHEVILGVRAAL